MCQISAQISAHFAAWTTVIGSLSRVPGHNYDKAACSLSEAEYVLQISCWLAETSEKHFLVKMKRNIC